LAFAESVRVRELELDLRVPLSLRIRLPVSLLIPLRPVSARIWLMPPVSRDIPVVSDDMRLVSLMEPVSLLVPAAPVPWFPRWPLHPATSATASSPADACEVHRIGCTSPECLACLASEGRT
jgi:hypothetical protein